MDGVTYLLRGSAGLDRRREEEPDDLALAGLDFLADYCQLGVPLAQRQRALGGVVVRQRDSVEADLTAASDQVEQARGAIWGPARVQVEVDTQQAASPGANGTAG